jgi:transposase InsO family protein
VEPQVRDEIVDYVREWSAKAEISSSRLVGWIGVGRSRFSDWKRRYGKANEHNGWVCRDWWLEQWEIDAIVDFFLRSDEREGYRRMAYMMLDRDVVAASPATIWRVLKKAGLIRGLFPKPSRKGRGFEQPGGAHQHWHIDVAYLNICGTFYYMCFVTDGWSRFIVHWDVREAMTEADVERVLQAAREKFPGARPRIISDNGPQFAARDFKEFIRISGMTHVRTSPYYPQSNGKAEAVNKTVKRECIRPRTPLSLEDARRAVGQFVEHYNGARLHSAISYVTPKDMLEGRRGQILAERDRKLEQARERRKAKRLGLTSTACPAQAASEPMKRTRAMEESNPPGIIGRGEQPLARELGLTPGSPQDEVGAAHA